MEWFMSSHKLQSFQKDKNYVINEILNNGLDMNLIRRPSGARCACATHLNQDIYITSSNACVWNLNVKLYWGLWLVATVTISIILLINFT